MLLYGDTDSAKNAVHLIFSGAPNPPIAPEKKRIHGGEVMVIPVADLVKMKLISHRFKGSGAGQIDGCRRPDHAGSGGETAR